MRVPDTAMLFAAGRGTRMRHLTADRPKPLIPVAGRPLLDHALDMLMTGGVRRVVVNTHYLAPMISDHLADLIRAGTVTLSHEAPDLLETGGGIRNARELLGVGPIVTANTDAVFETSDPLGHLCADWPQAKVEARLLLVPRDAALGHPAPGDFFLGADGRLTRRGDAATAPYIYTGVQILDPGAVYTWPEHVFSLNVIWDGMIARGTLFGVVCPGRWCDVGQPESLPLAEGLLQA